MTLAMYGTSKVETAPVRSGRPRGRADTVSRPTAGSEAVSLPQERVNMKLPLLLLLLLLGTVAALHQGNDAPYLDSQESQADLSQDLEGSGEQEGESVLTEETIQSEGEQVEASSCQDAFEDEEAMESDQDDLDENLQCPKEEDTVKILGSPGCKTCRYVLVRTCRRFRGARKFPVTDEGARDGIGGASRSVISDLTRDGELSSEVSGT
ncbi:Proteoglycan 3 [Myotis brandtii]|uniref:Proteoglycan 3 n=1 Tax=Myotis brandtii TaxID=109478 RepID=S7NQL6_MYOBR|nr:Proteoglycan 3 [Myotis brandtii]